MTSEFDDVPGAEECLLCYLERVLSAAGCDGSLRWTRRWRKARAPHLTGLERTLRSRGGFCDCEVVVNVLAGPPLVAESTM